MSAEKQKYRDAFLLLAIVLFVLLFLFPVAWGWHGVCYDDIRTFNYPNAVFQARCLQTGVVPLWDPHTFAGASPFYARIDGFSWYLPQWIASILSDAQPSDRAYQQLILFPLILHCGWAAAGAFILGRWGLRLSRGGAVVMALMYSLSSSFMLGLTAPHVLFSLSWQPWMVSVVLLYLRRRRPVRLAAGAVVFALGTTAWQVFGFHNLFSAGVFGLIALLITRKKQGARAMIKGAGGLLAMLVLSLLLAAPFWWSLKDYAVWVSGSSDLGLKALAEGPRSVPLRYLATIFVPELFGSSNFSTFWGVAGDEQVFWCEAYLIRGMLIWLPAILAIWAVWVSAFRRLRRITENGSPDRDDCPDMPGSNSPLTAHRSPLTVDSNALNLWTWTSLGMLIFSVLLMSGRHTPVFGLLYKLCPIFRLPYPSRWHTIFTLSLAVLNGIGATRLMEPGSAASLLTRRRLLTYVSLVTLISAAAVFLPFGYWRKLKDINWFLRNPGLYWLVCSILIGSLCFVLNRRWSGKLAVILALIGLLRSAWWDAYRPMGITWAAEQESLRWPSESPLFQFMDFAARFSANDRGRVGYSRAFADSRALLYGGCSLLGVSVKPLEPRVYSVLQELCRGWPYEISLDDPGTPFAGNMSVEYWWYGSRTPPSSAWEYLGPSSPPGLFLFRIPSFLPRVFTLDRFQPETEFEQRHDLIFRDLREAVLVDSEDNDAKVYLKGRLGPVGKEYPAYFNALQSANRISGADFSQPNRLKVELEIKTPAMLVLTDVYHPGWQATDNGRPVPIRRVNYIQRGIWLEKGRHEIMMRFRPAAAYSGRWFSLGGVLLLLTVFMRGLFRK